MQKSADSFADPLATALWTARERCVAVNAAEAWTDLSPERADAISAALYRRLTSNAPSAWKMGALDAETQERLGMAGPLVAPVLADRLHVQETQLSLHVSDFVQPKLEAEVGIRIDSAGHTFVPCVEVADCRFRDWGIPRYGAVADFGLQGAMLFGLSVAPLDEVRVSVRHDGVEVGSGGAEWQEIVDRLSLLPEVRADTAYVATGSMTPMFPAIPGLWEFDFRDLGLLTLDLI